MEGRPEDGRAEVSRAAAARSDLSDAPDRHAFILDNTRSRPVPLCPEITLRVADEAVPLWQKTEEQLGEMGLPPPFWAFAWAGGQALSRYVLDNPDSVRRTSVLDLGSGSGLVAIAAMKAGARAVLAADPDPWAEAAIGLNADLNGLAVDVCCADLLAADEACPAAETILVGDLFYAPDLALAVTAFLDRCLMAGIEVLVGDPGRSYLPHDRLAELAAYSVPVVGALEDNEIKRTKVYRLKPV